MTPTAHEHAHKHTHKAPLKDKPNKTAHTVSAFTPWLQPNDSIITHARQYSFSEPSRKPLNQVILLALSL